MAGSMGKVGMPLACQQGRFRRWMLPFRTDGLVSSSINKALGCAEREENQLAHK